MAPMAEEMDAWRTFDDSCNKILVFCAAMRKKYNKQTHESWKRCATEDEKKQFAKLQVDRRIAEVEINRYRPKTECRRKKGWRYGSA